jgi:hypothetical protein
VEKDRSLPLCYRKRIGLPIEEQKSPKIYIIEIKTVSLFQAESSRKKAGAKIEG